MPSSGFAGHVAVVTGGASGIGRTIAMQLAREGARVAVGDLDQAGLDQLVAEAGDAVIGVPTDVSQEDDIAALVDAAVDRFGRLSLAFNVAGAAGGGPLVGVERPVWDAVLATTLTGTFLSIKHEARRLAASGGGAIVNVSSINAFQAAHGAGAYCAAKSGVAMLTKSAALELADDGIRVNAVAPGLVDTPMTAFQREIPAIRRAFLDAIPLGRVGTTDDIAEAALFLASDRAPWITGVELVVDGGQTLTGYPHLTRLFAEASTSIESSEAHVRPTGEERGAPRR